MAANSVDWGAIAKILGSGNNAQPTNQSTLSKVLNSKALELGVGMVGAGLQARSEGKRADQQLQQNREQMNQNAAQFRVNTAMEMLQADQARRDAAGRNIASLTELGDEEKFAARQAFAAEMLPQLRNFSITPGDPAVAAAMPKISGGFRLPEGGLSAKTLEAFGPMATQAALARRRGQLDAMNPSTSEGDQNLMNVINMALEEDALSQSNARLAAEDGTVPNPDGTPPEGYEFDKKTGRLKKKGSSIWGKLGKAALIGGSVALTAATGGAASPLIPVAIGAGTGAAMGAMNGGGWKGALLGAGLGAATGGIGGGVGGSVGSGVKNALLNPRTLGMMGAQFVPGKAGQIAQIGTQFLPGGQTGLQRDVNVINDRMNKLGRR